MLRLEAVSKRYGRAAPVLTGVDLELTAGQVVAIKGGNGSGKSTLLRIVVGLSSPSTGVV
ncbi:MAG: ATP-binding cassette domain-containing protein, partial [Pseudonocardia sp.]|nr:ATP-binding cassette domain-containing protein [Pseudonocardia sp.]